LGYPPSVFNKKILLSKRENERELEDHGPGEDRRRTCAQALMRDRKGERKRKSGAREREKERKREARARDRTRSRASEKEERKRACTRESEIQGHSGT